MGAKPVRRFDDCLVSIFVIKKSKQNYRCQKNATCKYTSKCMQDTFIELVHTWFQADYTTIDSTCLKLKKKKAFGDLDSLGDSSWA